MWRPGKAPRYLSPEKHTRPVERGHVGEKLGVPFENIEIVFGDTDKVQFGMGLWIALACRRRARAIEGFG